MTFTIPTSSNASFSVSGSGNTCGNISRSLTFYAPSSLKKEISTEQSAVSVFPNPTADFINVNLDRDKLFSKDLPFRPSPEDIATTVQLQDAAGGLVRSINRIGSDSSVKIDIRDLPTGVYFLVVKRNGETHTEKIVKN